MANADWQTYYDENPIARWDRNRWEKWDPAIDYAFREQSVFTPLVQWLDYKQMAGGSNPTQFTTGREILPGHVNSNPIDVRQMYTNAAYSDMRERRIQAGSRWGGKVQLHRYDTLVNMIRERGETRGFIEGVLRYHMNRSIVRTHDRLARNALLQNVAVKTYAGGASDLGDMLASKKYYFQPNELRAVKLRLSYRSREALQQYGIYAQPVPGMNVTLAVTTPGVIHSLWNNFQGEMIQTLATLQDNRLLNGDVVLYQGFAFMQSWEAALFNMGRITRQVAVSQQINAGDGAPDPDATAIDNTWRVGQSSSGIKHVVYCSDLDANLGDGSTATLAAGDIVTLHTNRTAGWGIDDGVDVLDGMTQEMEVYSVDTEANTVTFRRPVMADYTDPFNYTTLNNQAASGVGYGYITKALDMHPVYMIGARGGNLFAMMERVQFYNPEPTDDFKSVYRYTWDMFGSMNPWNPDLWEVHWAVGDFGNRAAVGIS